MEADPATAVAVLAPLIVGKLSRYGKIDAETVAKTVVGLVVDGYQTYENTNLNRQ